MSVHQVSQRTRRAFLSDVFSAGAFVLGASLLPKQAHAATAATSAFKPSVFLGLEPSGTLIVVAHRSEMGTGIRTALPMVLADEMEADWKRVTIEQALGDPKYGSQNTDGSCSIRDFYKTMRVAGSSARLMLERAAAKQWNVPPAECEAKNHEVVHTKSGKKAGFGELAKAAAAQPVPKENELKFKTPAQYRYVGKDIPIYDMDAICNGKGIFGMDVKVPGMVYASIERCPVYGGKVKSFDASAAKKVAGVSDVVQIEAFKPPHSFQALGGVAVIANNTWAAMQGRKALKVDWDLGPHASYDSAAYRKELLDAARKPQKVVRNIGNVDAEFAKGGKLHEASYYAPLLSHAPMEPPAAVADFRDGQCTVWTATQNPQAVQETLAPALGIPKEKVICNVTLLGGGFGRKSKPDYVAEAAILSKKLGKPVKVVWSREEDIRFDFYHSVAGMHMKAVLDAKGRPTAWLQRSVFPSIGTTFDPKAEYAMDLEMGMGWVDLPFDIPNHRAENGPAKNHVRIGWLRSVAHVYHAFAIHSFIGELAAAANRDPVEYYLDLLGKPRKVEIKPEGFKYWNNDQGQDKYPVDTARLRRVIEVAAEKSGWAKKKPTKGRALGIAAHRSFLSYIAAVVEVEVDNQGKVRIPRVDLAVDCGTIIHPERVRSQFEGAAVFGTSLAMMGEITAANGRIQQSNYHDYPVARMNDAPYETHVHIVPSTDLPAGVGEPGVPVIAPAICNAIFRATGKRVRELPIKRTKLV
ncbi:MAG: xanthine dehydrogenase family protein molybdopterin-binding subunit [Acidobacteria bacterium]|nr:xanthine dehydrogenase family protein molybdopterin-binding subunit [Acidobacteriota bacterium]